MMSSYIMFHWRASMLPNPGGVIPANDVVGRDGLIAVLWEKLTATSVVMVAERRIGKTSVVKKMQAEARGGFDLIYRDVEGLRSPLLFVERVLDDVDERLTPARRVSERVREARREVGAPKVMGVELPAVPQADWRTLLGTALSQVAEGGTGLVVFIWDELPAMLANIHRECGATAAMELLDTLRALRQTYPDKLRMVYTGSIGLHHIISRLRQEGYTNDPTNDMATVEVPPLAPDDARDLATRLLEGKRVLMTDTSAVAAVIADGVDCVPYYIHYVISSLPSAANVDAEAARKAVSAGLTDGNDPWHLAHYRERLAEYYPQTWESALVLLDAIAGADAPLGTEDVTNLARHARVDVQDEAVRDLLKLLRRDHYLQLNRDGAYDFKFALIKRWWRLDRGLMA
jgi:hypothetical protein